MAEFFSKIRLSPGPGVELQGVVAGLRYPDDYAIRLREVFLQERVLLLRNFSSDLAHQIALTQCLGPLVRSSPPKDGGSSDVLVRIESEDDLNPYNALWHSDRSWSGRPVAATALYAIDATPDCPTTELADMCGLAQSLSCAERRLLSNEYMIHDVLKSRQLRSGAWHQLKELPPSLAMRMVRRRIRHYLGAVRTRGAKAGEAEHSAVHPVLSKSPLSGSEYVYLGEHAWRLQQEGDNSLEKKRLIKELERRIRPVTRHRWSPGDLLIFDNLTLLHRREPSPVPILGSKSRQRRELRRTMAWLNQ